MLAYLKRINKHSQILKSPSWYFHIFITLVAVVGLLLGRNSTEMFTTQANLLVVGYFTATVFLSWRANRTVNPAPIFRGAIVAWVLFMLIVVHYGANYGTIPNVFAAPDIAGVLDNIKLFVLHYIVSSLVLIDWLLSCIFTRWNPESAKLSNKIHWYHPLIWLVYPCTYIILVVLRGSTFPYIDDPYPYPFLNPDISHTSNMWLAFFGTLPLLAMGAIGSGYIIYATSKYKRIIRIISLQNVRSKITKRKLHKIEQENLSTYLGEITVLQKAN